MPNIAKKERTAIAREGCQCRFCGFPVIRGKTRDRIWKAHADALQWGARNRDKHSALQALDLHYDHISPHARGGDSDLSKMVIACSHCNFRRSNLTLAESALNDPRDRQPIKSSWDGLESFKQTTTLTLGDKLR
jgi:5-methylcytosine-specific restriction endonuclease McrA